MGSLTGLKLHVAQFFDVRGKFIGTKTFKFSSKWGLAKRTFVYRGGTYNVNSEVSRSEISTFPYLVDHVYYFYTMGNPDPLEVRHQFKPLVRSEDYNIQLESKVLRDLNKVRQGGLAALLTPQNIIIALIIIGIILYLTTGGSITGGQPPPAG